MLQKDVALAPESSSNSFNSQELKSWKPVRSHLIGIVWNVEESKCDFYTLLTETIFVKLYHIEDDIDRLNCRFLSDFSHRRETGKSVQLVCNVYLFVKKKERKKEKEIVSSRDTTLHYLLIYLPVTARCVYLRLTLFMYRYAQSTSRDECT